MPVPPKMSFLCEAGDHSDCGHKFGTAASLLGRGSRAMLCECECHASCPLGELSEVSDEEWQTRCTCPGSVAARVRSREARQHIATMQARHREVMESIDLGRGKTPDEIKTLIQDAYVERGWESPTSFESASRLASAATARRARGLRVAFEFGKALRSAANKLRAADSPENDRES